MHRFELFLDLVQFCLSLLINFLDLSLENPINLSLEPAHVIAVVLLDDELELGLLSLQLRLADVIFTHAVYACLHLLACR